MRTQKTPNVAIMYTLISKTHLINHSTSHSLRSIRRNMMLNRQVIKARPQIIRCAIRSFASEAQTGVGREALSSNTSSTSSAAILLGAAVIGALTAGTVTFTEESKYRTRPAPKYESPRPIPVKGPESHHSDYNEPPPRPDLPTIPLEEVREHTDEDSMWFTFRGAVYDLTFFQYGHPGGTPVSPLKPSCARDETSSATSTKSNVWVH
jgi:hypothetical protein